MEHLVISREGFVDYLEFPSWKCQLSPMRKVELNAKLQKKIFLMNFEILPALPLNHEKLTFPFHSEDI